LPTCGHCSLEIPVSTAYCPRCGTPNPESPTLPTPTSGAQITEHIPADELKQRLQAALGQDLVVQGELGEGGFAVVFAVEDRKLSRRIAVKVLRPELTVSRSTVQRFVREAKAAAGLSHPHILPIFFVGEGEGLVYFGMPLVEGETLESLLSREKRLREPEVTRIGAEIAEALAEAHRNGLVHRDVKPANVLLQGPTRRVLVADFGIAKAAAGSGEKLTGTGVVIGSPHYMSPEQAAGSGDVDHRSDVYSLGVVLWQMLAGALPFDAADSQDVLMQHITRPLPPLRKRRKDVSPRLTQTVERCCAKLAGDRFQSAADLGLALRTGVAPAAPRRLALARPSRGMLIALAGALVLGVAILLVPARTSPPPNADTEVASAATAAPAAPPSAAPALAVLPFDVNITGDTAQWSRHAARSLATTMLERFGVATVDFNQLLGQWTAQHRTLSAPLDSNAAFAYRMSANQVVMGSIFEAGRQVRVAADIYDTRTIKRIGHGEQNGSPDNLIALLDRLAGSVAVALCHQPEFNPHSLCFDAPAHPRAPVTVTLPLEFADSQPAFYVLVSREGVASDPRPKNALPGFVILAAARALTAVAYAPARKRGAAVEAWSVVSVTLRAPPASALSVSKTCDAPTTSLQNPQQTCWDARATPMAPPQVAVPPSCAASPGPAMLLVHVSPRGETLGMPTVTGRSKCAKFDQTAAALMADMRYSPARKSGQPVAAWLILLVRPSP